jgi:hypothetical protein
VTSIAADGRLDRARLPVVAAALAAGAWTAATFEHALGVNLAVAAALAAVAAGCARGRSTRRVGGWRVVWAVTAMAFAALPAWADDSWLHPFTTAAAVGFGTLAVTGGVGWRALLGRPFAAVPRLVAGPRWVLRGLGPVVPRRLRTAPWGRAVMVSAVLAVVFGGLFAAGDAVVAAGLGAAADAGDPRERPWRWLLFAGGFAVVAAVAFVAARPGEPEAAPAEARGRRTYEWALPLLVLDVLFAVFVYVQIAVVVFDGYHDVLARQGINYATYARQGFATLLVVTALTLAVVAVASAYGPRRGMPGRRLFEALVGVLCLLALAVVVAALHRLRLYVEFSGLTRLRLCAATFELWLGVLLVLIVVLGPLRRAARHLPRIAALAGAVLLLALGAASPDALIARVAVAQYRAEGVVDVRDLEGLSAGAVPWLDRLPEPERSCLLRPIAAELARGEAWFETNAARNAARDVLARRPVAEAQCANGGRGPRPGSASSSRAPIASEAHPFTP